MDMIFELEATPPKKLPTLYQFLKSAQSAKLKTKYFVKVIWMPGDYPNLTLQTEDFRALVSEDNPLFDSLNSFCRNMIDSNTAFAIVINPSRDGGFGITSMSEQGEWKGLGAKGFQFHIAVNKTKPRK